MTNETHKLIHFRKTSDKFIEQVLGQPSPGWLVPGHRPGKMCMVKRLMRSMSGKLTPQK